MHHFGSISNKIEDQSAVVFVRKNDISHNDALSQFCQFHHKVQEVNFQLMQLLAKSKIGQEVLIIGENSLLVYSSSNNK